MKQHFKEKYKKLPLFRFALLTLGTLFLTACEQLGFDKEIRDDLPEEIIPQFARPETTEANKTTVENDLIKLSVPDSVKAKQSNRIQAMVSGTNVLIDAMPDASFAEAIIGTDTELVPVRLEAHEGVTVPALVGMFAKELNFQYAFDPAGVPGNIAISLETKMTRAQMWQLLERLLNMNGAFLSYDLGIVWVRPWEKAASDGTVQPGKNDRSNVAIRLFRLKTVEAKGVLETLKPFGSQKGVLMEIPGQNSILVMDNSDNMQKIASIITTVDQINEANWFRAVIPVHNISPSRMSYELEQVLTTLGYPISAQSNTSGAGSSANSSKFGAIKLVPIDRIQALLVTAATEDAIREIERWSTLLDSSDHDGQEQVFIYQIINGKAEELVKILSYMFNAETTQLEVVRAEVSEGKGARTQAQSSSSSSSTTSSSSANSRNAAATAADNSGPASPYEIPAKIFSDAEHNRLIVRTTPRVYGMMKALLERIDTVPTQVLLEVKLCEVNLTNGVNIGSQFTFSNGHVSYGTNYSNLGTTGGGTNEAGDIIPVTPKTEGFNYMWDNGDGSSAFLNALAKKGNVTFIATPNIVAMSGKSAQLQVGEEVPIITGQYTNTQSQAYDGSMNQSIDYKKTGIMLTVTPRVTKGGLIQLDVMQEVSQALKNQTSDITSPTIQTRKFETTMAVRNGSTLIMGGLLRDRKEETINALPFLVDIPVLNLIGGTSTQSKQQDELILMITAKIVSEVTPQEASVEKYFHAIDAIRRMEAERIISQRGASDVARKSLEIPKAKATK